MGSLFYLLISVFARLELIIPRGMTVCAGIGRVIVHFIVVSCGVAKCVLMTSKTGIGRSGARMTGCARHSRVLSMRQREGMLEG